MMPDVTITLYTDGACSGNPGPGGYAAILVTTDPTGNVIKELVVTGNAPHTTNNRMEIMAAIAGLQSLTQPSQVTIVSDSEYLVRTMTQHWKRKKNQDLWAEVDALAAIHTLSWKYVRGHAGHSYNERCDRLAVAEIARLRRPTAE
jgi:ribonuclease HI